MVSPSLAVFSNTPLHSRDSGTKLPPDRTAATHAGGTAMVRTSQWKHRRPLLCGTEAWLWCRDVEEGRRCVWTMPAAIVAASCLPAMVVTRRSGTPETGRRRALCERAAHGVHHPRRIRPHPHQDHGAEALFLDGGTEVMPGERKFTTRPAVWSRSTHSAGRITTASRSTRAGSPIDWPFRSYRASDCSSRRQEINARPYGPLSRNMTPLRLRPPASPSRR